ncbi:Hypothetical protein PHPALM_11510 [Phytophthora palmivora]|uniref:PiggyBac transposable element-derived protein domain-containing protein n=1 Tax=Phytophthora palmivora TaxID=4796 RepID=A0A2P4Y244_9STRA|nr:Hypothetical protein PHPALM_11510 [Phytophthora palmivora]
MGIVDGELRAITQSGWVTYDERRVGDLQVHAADDYYGGLCGPTRSAVAYADSPIGMFFTSCRKLCGNVLLTSRTDTASRIYRAMAASRRLKLLQRQAKDPRVSVPGLDEIDSSLRIFKAIKPTRSVVAPMRDGLAGHWRQSEDGTIPRGTFSRYMKRERFETIMKFLHFSDSTSSAVKVDRAWKIRPILQTVEKTFRRGYRLGRVLSFDEGMIPYRSKLNPVRVFMPNKPSKYGTKFYMTCCADTAYCVRYGQEEQQKKDGELAGVPKAVALNGQPAKRLIVTDRFYSSVALSLRLLALGYYHVGTTRTDRLGWCAAIQFSQKKGPKSMARGTYRIAQALHHPALIALSWMDSQPVNMLATGCSTHPSTVLRTEKNGSRSTVPCPELVVDYGKGMGGVDVLDQLRLQRYSIQKCVTFRKYYKQLFLGVVDMAVVNGFIIHNIIKKGKAYHLPHMPSIYDACTRSYLVSVPIRQQVHKLENVEDRYRPDIDNKHRQHLCKVCSAFAPPKTKSFENMWYCSWCSEAFDGHVPLCIQV